jgi:hypothetical protein
LAVQCRRCSEIAPHSLTHMGYDRTCGLTGT